jgi:DNA helicase-2/ATP-dependent DNA helicase PcrA
MNKNFNKYPEKPGQPLNPQQKSAAEAPLKPLLIIAGAGTGKTQTLTSRLVYLINEGVPSSQIIAITFTNKAAGEMKDRIKKEGISLSDEESPFIGTFHAFGARMARKEARLVGRNPGFTIFDSDDSLSLIKKIIKSFNFKEKISAAEIQNQISSVKNNLLLPEEADFKNQEIFEEVFKEYERKLIENDAFDFDDLIEKPVRILRDNPEILKKYRRQISHILIDEYQDVNYAQYALVKFLAGDEGKISVVGDDQQAIYSWRGANFKFFLDFEKDWPQGEVVILEENYRSTGKIIKAASELIKNNANQRQKNLWTKKDEGKSVEILEAKNADEEAEWIAEKIKGGENFGASAVLYRTNAQSRALEESLISRDIPYRIIGGLKFYERREIKDIVSALRIFANPLDSISLNRLEKLLRKKRFASFSEKWSALKASSKGKISPADLINEFLKIADYLVYLKNNFINAFERQENVKELIGFAAGFSDLDLFLEHLALFEATDNLKDKEKAVKLTTIHLAKGLEFDKVFIAGASEGLLPHARALLSLAEIEEERRLMYVAMTRAKKELYVSFYGLPSRFISEIPVELAEFKSLNANHNFSDFESFKNRDDEEDYIDY